MNAQETLVYALDPRRPAPAAEPRQFDALHLLGVLALQASRWEEAERLLLQAIRLDPSAAEAHIHLGNVYRAVGKLPEAKASYRRALAYRGDHPQAHFTLGTVLADQGNLAEATTAFRRALELAPRFLDAERALVTVLLRLRSFAEVEAICRAQRDRVHREPNWLKWLGIAILEQGRAEEAAAIFHTLIGRVPQDAEAHVYLGRAVHAMGLRGAARACHDTALELDPQCAAAYFHRGVLLMEDGELEHAITAFRRALTRAPRLVEAHSHLGVTLRRLGRMEEAVASCETALELQPDVAERWLELGVVLHESGDWAGARDAYETAIRLRPDLAEAHWRRGAVLVSQGKYEAGWSEYEWRWRVPGLPAPRSRSRAPRWTGAPLHGATILVHVEAGAGEAFLCARYLPLVAARGGRVVLECPASLADLLATAPGVHQVVTAGSALPYHTVHASLQSLPALFRTTMHTIPGVIPYLRPPRSTMPLPLGEGARVGIALAAPPSPGTPVLLAADLAPLLRTSGVTWYSLQHGTAAEHLRDHAPDVEVHDLGDRLADAAAAAGALVELDLVITGDPAIAHLAGALGIPVWVLLPFVPDWPWLIGRSDSPWYPTVRCFRQETRGEWRHPIQAVQGALGRLVGRNRK